MKRTAKILLLVSFLNLPLPSWAQTQPEWRMEQTHFLEGAHVVFFTPRAIKIVNKASGCQLVSKAPDWTVNIFRTDDKLLCQLTLAEFLAKHNYRVGKKHRSGLIDLHRSDSFGAVKANLYRRKDYDYWVSNIEGIPFEVVDIIAAHYRVAVMNGVVLKAVSNSTESVKRDFTALSFMDEKSVPNTLDTKNVKKVTYNAADFAVPTGLRRVSDLKQLRTSTANRDEAESIFQQLGVGENIGKPKH